MMAVVLFGCSKKAEEPVFDIAKLDIKEGIYLRDDTKSSQKVVMNLRQDQNMGITM